MQKNGWKKALKQTEKAKQVYKNKTWFCIEPYI